MADIPDTPGDSLSALRAALGAQYAIERILGQGGMGAVYLARDLTLDRPVAIKVINPDVASNATIRDRFLQEARTVAKLRHPNIVPVYAAGDASGMLYFVMEYVPGESLRDLLARETRLDPARAERILNEMAQALDHAHKQGLVHRDIKPENILLDAESGRALLTDFGVARAFEKDGGLTQTGMILGSPRYMSPEQASGDRAIDGRSDLYSLALVGYEMFSGAPVVQSGTAAGMLVKHLTETPAPLAHQSTAVPADIAAAIDRGLAKDPADRWQTGAEFAAALAGQAGASRTGSRPAATTRSRRIPFSVVVAIAVAVGTALWFSFARGGPVGTAYLVTPFEIQSGDQSVAWLHDGSVNMLTLTLGQWGDLQVVDYERTLSLLDKAGLGDKPRVSLDDARMLARRAKAGTVVTGQIQTIHDSLIVVAKLYDTRSGRAKNQAQVAAALGADPRPLFDQLAQRLLQIAGGPTSTMQLSQATTSSIEAYRAYLNGVKLLNAWRLPEAAAAFSKAIDIDSTFALAYHKLSLTLGWSGATANPKYIPLTDRAVALDGRLPPREKSLVEGHNHLAHALAAAGLNDTTHANYEVRMAIKSYTDLFARGDTLVAEAWYGLADAYFHGRLPANSNKQNVDYTTRALRGFNKTLAVDSTFHLAYSHLIQLYNAAGSSSFILISGDSAIGLANEGDVGVLGGAAVVKRLRDSARAHGVSIARAWTRAEDGSTQAFLQLAQSYAVAERMDSAVAALHDALSKPRSGGPAARLALLSIQIAAGDTGLHSTVTYILDSLSRDSLLTVSAGSRFSIDGELMAAAAFVGRGADIERAVKLAYSVDSVLPGSPQSSEYIFQFYKLALQVAMGDSLNAGMRRGLAGGIQGIERIPGNAGAQARSGSVSVPYLLFLSSGDTAYLSTLHGWSLDQYPELDARVALMRHDTATAMKLAQAFPAIDALTKADPPYSLGGMRATARAEVLADLGFTRQAVDIYGAVRPSRLQRTSFAEPGYAIWVRSILARARLLKQLGERDRAIAAYEEFIMRWRNADGIAAKQVTAAKQELAQIKDAPQRKS